MSFSVLKVPPNNCFCACVFLCAAVCVPEVCAVGDNGFQQRVVVTYSARQDLPVDPAIEAPYESVFKTSVNEESSLAQYKWRILTLTSLVSLLGVLMLLLLTSRVRRRKAERDANEKRAALQLLAARLLMLQDEERKRVASELHDSLGQSLAIIKNLALMRLRARQRDVDDEQLLQIVDTATSAIAELRQIAHNLRPFELDRLGLTAAIESMIEKVSETGAINIEGDLEEVTDFLSPDAETSVYRIVQEALNNVVKHSNATAVRVEMKRNGKRLDIRIHDNGKGMPPRPSQNNHNRPTGVGLAGIAERVRALGGSFVIDSKPKRGTTLSVHLESSNGSTP